MALSSLIHHRASSTAARMKAVTVSSRIRPNLPQPSAQDTHTISLNKSRFNAIPSVKTRRDRLDLDLDLARQQANGSLSHCMSHSYTTGIDSTSMSSHALATTRLHPFTVMMLRYQTLAVRNNQVHYPEDEVQKGRMDNKERVDGQGDGTKEEHSERNMGLNKRETKN